MTAALAAGALAALGLVLAATGWRPAPVPLARALATRQPQPEPAAPTTATARMLGASWQQTAVARRLVASARADLAVLEVDPVTHLAQRAGWALGGALAGPTLVAVLWAGGISLHPAAALWLAGALAPVGLLYPGLQLRATATDRRRTFRHAVGAFVDVVAVALAGGRGVDSALHEAADAGTGWPFEAIRAALLEARLRGEPPWAALTRLGERTGVDELRELAASIALAGTEGARVKASLAAKARSLRLRSLTEIEAAAQSASERMSLPVVLLMVGFVVFLAYPAVIHVLDGI